MKAVILAGGKGTRLGKITKNIPKPMIKIGNLTILEHQINCLRQNNIKDIFILTHHFSDIIQKYFGNGKNFGVKITYFNEAIPLGTAGGLKEIENKLDKDFLVIYGDVMFDMNLKKLIAFHKNKKSICTLTLHPNNHPYDSDLVEINEALMITNFHSKPHPENKYFQNLVNAGLYALSPKILKYIKKGRNADFGKDIFPEIFKKEKMYGYITAEYLKDMGTPERLKQITKDFISGKIEKLNSKNKRKAIFLDRDGTINYDPDNLSKIEDFQLLPKITEAINLINSSEYLAIVVSNQPMVAKGFMDIKDVEEIHKKMETVLGLNKAKLDGIYYCPHHPDKGFAGENIKYKTKCDCRKPRTGMIKKAKKDFNIDLKNSWIIGDSERDVLAGINAGMKTILVKRNQEKFENCRHKTKKANNLYSAVNFIVSK